MGSLLPESIDVAAGIVFVYLFMSILATIGREAFEGFMKRRARNLEKGLVELLCDHPAPKGSGATSGYEILKAFYDHPLIMSLYRGRYNIPPKRTFTQGRQLPSYIPPSHFAYVVLDVLAEAGGQNSSGQLDTQTILNAADGLNNRRLAKMIQFAINNSGGDIDKSRQFIEAWFNATMDRVSGWYRLETQTILFWISLVACVVLNVNTVVIADSLWRSPSLRKTLEVQAEAYYNGRPSAIDSLQPPVTNMPATAGGVANPAADEVATGTSASAVPMPPASAPVTAVPVPTTQANPPPAATLVTNGDIPGLLNATDPLEKLGLPLGWNSQTITAMHRLFPQAPRVSVAEAQAMQKAENTAVTGANPIEWGKNLLTKMGFLWDSTVDAYESNNQDPAKNALFHAAGTLSLIMGWVMTAFAVTLGAPFWFDVLGKLMMVRSTMKPGDKGSSTINFGAIAASLTSGTDTARMPAATASYLPDFSTVGADAPGDGDLTHTLDPNSRPRDP